VSERHTESDVVVSQVRPSANEEEIVAITSALQSLLPTPTRRRVVEVDDQWRFAGRLNSRSVFRVISA